MKHIQQHLGDVAALFRHGCMRTRKTQAAGEVQFIFCDDYGLLTVGVSVVTKCSEAWTQFKGMGHTVERYQDEMVNGVPG